VLLWTEQIGGAVSRVPLSSEPGTHKTVKALA